MLQILELYEFPFPANVVEFLKEIVLYSESAEGKRRLCSSNVC